LPHDRDSVTKKTPTTEPGEKGFSILVFGVPHWLICGRMHPEPVPPEILALKRPDRALWRYYLVSSFLSGPAIFFTLPYLFFRFHTLRYEFDAEGIHMKVGLLFRREINLTYARVQDIHLRSGVIQRWFGLASVEIQTASGSTGAELVIEGFKQYEAIRDFLYTRMRGYQSQRADRLDQPVGGILPISLTHHAAPAVNASHTDAELINLLGGIRDELRKTRQLLEQTQRPASSGQQNV